MSTNDGVEALGALIAMESFWAYGRMLELPEETARIDADEGNARFGFLKAHNEAYVARVARRGWSWNKFTITMAGLAGIAEEMRSRDILRMH